MEKQYKHLMEQQSVDTEVTAGFYEKLKNTGTRRKTFRWKMALAVACIALMIPITVLAASNTFRKGDVQIGNVPHFPTIDNSYSVRFNDIQSTPLSALPKEVQSITEHKRDYLNSWAAAAKITGMDLLRNTALENDGIAKIGVLYDGEPAAHCIVSYNTSDEQLYYVGVEASYYYQNTSFYVRAKLTVEHPDLTEEEKNTLHGITVGMNYDVQISHEEYTTAAGVPAIILRSEADGWLFYHAVFAVDNISYEIQVRGSTKAEAATREALLEVLDAYVVE